MDDLNEKIKRVFADLGIRCAYNMPSFWANGGKDYKVIPTRYAKGYQKALEDAEREITEVLSEQPEQSSEIQDILEYLDTVLHPIISPDHWNVYSELHDMISMLPPTQPEHLVKESGNLVKGLVNDCISRQAAIRTIADTECEYDISPYIKDERTEEQKRKDWFDMCKVLFRQIIEDLPSAQPRWIPVTLETLPNLNSVVVVCGKKGTWDYGTYRGWSGDIHSWQWKKNTIKHVYWWMYKADALPEQYEGEQDENN